MLINAENFKKCLSRFPTGVSILTTRDSLNNKNAGVTIGSLTSLSLEPALILFSLSKTANTHEIFLREKNFIVNILSNQQTDLSEQFASHIDNKWDGVRYQNSSLTSLPIIENITSYLECKHYCNYEGGDHTIFLGEVINLEILSEAKPLIHYKSKYYSVSD